MTPARRVGRASGVVEAVVPTARSVSQVLGTSTSTTRGAANLTEVRTSRGKDAIAATDKKNREENKFSSRVEFGVVTPKLSESFKALSVSAFFSSHSFS